MTRPTESAEVRKQIARALRLDLIGPWAGHALADERLRGWERPSNWYLTGFLVPRGAPVEQRGDADVDDEPEVAERAGLGDDSTEDRRAAKKGFFPSSMGLSFLVSEGVDALEVLVRWGDYRRVEAESGDPNRDRTEQGGEAEAERDQRETPAERRGDATGRLGEWPFEIGLWVGKAGTPNHLGEKGDGRSDSARAKVSQYKNNPRGRPTPIPMESCPWCGEDFTPDSIALLPNAQMPADLRIACANWQCEFSSDHPLPIVAVDEPLYRRLPAFLIATVDKFASLPWVGVSGALLGGADRYDATGFYGAAEPRRGNRLARPLPPPDLVIQDELHLISGPLGTMAGLYETVIESLCAQEIGGQRVPLAAQARFGNIPLAARARLGNIPLAAQARLVRPEIVASTATVRHARDRSHSVK